MISSDIRINGALIAHLHATNVSVSSGSGMARYEWTYHNIKTGSVSRGELTHIRADGAAVLISEILQAYERTQRLHNGNRRSAEKGRGVHRRVRSRSPKGGQGKVRGDDCPGQEMAASESGALVSAVFGHEES